MEQACEEMGGETLQRTVGEIRFGAGGGQVRSITLSSNTVMPLGASFPSRIVLLVFVFGSTFYSSLCTESSPLLSLPTVIVSSSSSSLICCFISGNQETKLFRIE